MHQDQRIGLALAVLLLGAAGAFFFRNDPRPAGPSTRLKSAKELDARIAEKSITPYLQNNDEDHEHGITVKKVSGRNGNSAGGDRSLPQLETPDFFGPEEPHGQGSAVGANEQVQELSPIPFPGANGESPAGRDAADASSQTPVATEKMHIVQKGETLSSIAAKEMGSSSKFHELFEANRDQLNDPNGVYVGMSLRIPSRRASRTETPVTRDKSRRSTSAPPLIDAGASDVGEMPPIAAPDKSAPNRPAEPSSVKRRFEPAKSPPSAVKGLGTQSSEAVPAAKPMRKLTQLPPKDAGGKVAR